MGDVAERVSYELVPLDLIDPDPDNLRREFPDLDKTAEGFETNFVNPGEPFNPPIVVRDGERFRLVDGERRWRAMRLAGRVRECHALVCDGVGAAEAVLAMLATDDKRRLTDEERDRGVQLALKVGVRPSEVDKAAGMRRGTAKRVMAGMRVAGGREYSQQTTEAYLLSLEHQGDDEILDLIAGYCGPNLRVAVDQVVRRRAGEAAREAVLAALDGAGVARGAALGVIRLRPPAEGADKLRVALREQLDPASRDGIISMHLLENDPVLSKPLTADAGKADPGAGDWFVLVDATDVSAVPAVAASITGNAAFTPLVVTSGVYRLLWDVAESDLPRS